MKEIHRNIKHYRKLAKLTQEELAKAVGYKDRSMIAKIEKGEVDLPQDRIEAFARVFGISPEELAGWSPDEKLSLEYCVEQEMRLLGWKQYYDSDGNVALSYDGRLYDTTDENIKNIEKRVLAYLEKILNAEVLKEEEL